MERILIASADGHAGGKCVDYENYLEKQYLDDLQQVIREDEVFAESAVSQRRYTKERLDIMDQENRIRDGGEEGAWDIDKRLAELDREGVAAEIVLSGTQLGTLPFFHPSSEAYSAELREAGMRAFHRQLADFIAGSDGRCFGLADPGTCLDMDATVKELRWVKEHGFVGVHPPKQIEDPDLPPLYDEYYEPFWAACAELGIVINSHAGYGTVQGEFAIKGLREMMGNPNDEDLLKIVMTSDMSIDKMPYDSPARLGLTKPRRVIWQMMLGGVFERHPDLKVVLSEVRADWVPDTIGYLDKMFDEGKLPTKRRPSEYWETNFAVCPSSPRPYEIALLDEIGVDRFMFGTDYPHPEGTWPNTWDWIRTTFANVSEDDARKVLGENTVRFYGLPREPLVKIAEKIGPKPEDVLGGGFDISDDLIETFHYRSGYKRPAESLDPGFMDSMLEQDVAGAAA